jgi:hypothetical protein
MTLRVGPHNNALLTDEALAYAQASQLDAGTLGRPRG